MRKGKRGLITGKSAALGGLISLVIGVSISTWEKLQQPQVLIILMFAAGIMWFLGALVFRSIDEPVDPEADGGGLNKAWWKDTWDLFTENRAFRNFVIVRSLMLVSAFHRFHGHAQEVGSDMQAWPVPSRIRPFRPDRRAFLWKTCGQVFQNAMSIGAAVSSAIILVTLVAVHLGPDEVAPWILPTAFFALNLAHITIRVARKTYIVDMAESDVRTRYVGAATTLRGVILLIVGLISGVIAMWGASAALIFLAAVGLVGVFAASRLPEVSKRA